jgi:tetratricopeptide (TPR) repeat protein
MEEDRELDITDKRKVNRIGVSEQIFRKKVFVKQISLFLFNLLSSAGLLFYLLSYLFLSSCSLPRIIILDDPLSPEEHINLGVAYEGRGEFDAAIKEYRAASKKTPIAYLYLGNVYFVMKEYDKAEEYYKEAIEQDPLNADAYNNLAWLYYTTRRNLKEAEKLVLEAIKLNPSKSEIYKDTLNKIRNERDL